MASTVADDGAEECFCGCNMLTTKRFVCVRSHKVWMCGNCHRYRPVCPVALQGGAVCRAGEEDYKTDTDLDSRPDSSFSLEDPLVEHVELYAKVARGDFEVNRYKAHLQLNIGQNLVMAGMTSGDEKRDALRDAQNAARESEWLFIMLSAERQENIVCDMYAEAEALLLQASTGACLAENDAMLEAARDKARQGVAFLKRLQNLTGQAAALRFEGAIKLGRKRFKDPWTDFGKDALKKFLESSQFPKTVWCAVTAWTMYILKKQTGHSWEAVGWLKQGTLLDESIEGENHPYRRQYRDCREKINPKNPTDLSENEVKSIERALGALHISESLPPSP